MEISKFLLVIIVLIFLVQFCWRIQTSGAHANKNTDQDLKSFIECTVGNLGAGSRSKVICRDLNSATYNNLNKQWNLRLKTVNPRAYFLPTTGQDVAEAVKCGIKANIHLIPSSGGHSFEGLSWGTDDQIVVDLRNMNEVRLESSDGQTVAIVEAGANLAQVMVHLWENGGYAASMGSCLTVGVGGHITGGGVGWYAGIHGIAADNMLEAEVVDGLGNLVQVNGANNADLFWAIRGSGPGYIGILTQVKIKVFKASDMKMTLVQMRYSVKDFAQGFIAMQNFQNWLEANDQENAFLGFTLTSDSYNQTIPSLTAIRGFSVAALHIQDPIHQPKPIDEYMKAVREMFPAPAQVSAFNITYLQHITLTSSAPVILKHPTTGRLEEIGNTLNYYNYAGGPLPSESQVLSFLKLMQKEDAAPRYFKAKGFFTSGQFSMEQMLPVQGVMERIPPGNIWILAVVAQRRMKQIARNATAYVHRSPSIELTIQYEGSDRKDEVDVGTKFLYDLYDAMKFMDGGESYQNIPDLDDKDFLNRYFKENLAKLIDIKAKWDPQNYFISKLSLPLTQVR